MSEHIPGPWEYVEGDFNHDEPNVGQSGSIKAVRDENGIDWHIATVENAPHHEANARLMAAAPDLYRVAQLLVSWLDEEEGAHKLCDAARAAIAKVQS